MRLPRCRQVALADWDRLIRTAFRPRKSDVGSLRLRFATAVDCSAVPSRDRQKGKWAYSSASIASTVTSRRHAAVDTHRLIRRGKPNRLRRVLAAVETKNRSGLLGNCCIHKRTDLRRPDARAVTIVLTGSFLV